MVSNLVCIEMMIVGLYSSVDVARRNRFLTTPFDASAAVGVPEEPM
jgi:hypothetical protein